MSTSSERQRRFISNLSPEQLDEHRAKHAASQRRSYYKRTSKDAGTETVAERKTLKAKTLKPETLRRKEKSLKEQSAALVVMEHYKRLLIRLDWQVRRAGIAWFRVCLACRDPYAMFSIEKPFNFTGDELIYSLPGHWRFDRNRLTKNYHPPYET